MKIQIANEELELLPERAFVWGKKRLLGLSDVHIGKAESYQAAGVPIPSGGHRDDLKKISELIQKFDIEHVVILGDWIHDKNSVSSLVDNDLMDFFKRHDKVYWTLLIGNHEKSSLERLKKFPFHLVMEDLVIEPFLLTHGHKLKETEYFQIQGHTHPYIMIHDGPLKLKLPCFQMEPDCLTIPAFGSMTGGYTIRPGKRDRIFAVGTSEIFEVAPK
jgi:Predicted ICC-like phosphoesterases